MSAVPPPIDLNSDLASPAPLDRAIDLYGPDSEVAAAAEEGAGVDLCGVQRCRSAHSENGNDGASVVPMEVDWLEMPSGEDEAKTTDSARENVDEEPLSYVFWSEEKREFSISDMVWGKVKSHPWWPGQIFDTAYASEMALKHQRKEKNFLVCYFGDKTFAWCDSAQLRHLRVGFPIMEKQSCTEAFSKAVKGALAEVSRRVELGLICGCTSEEVLSSLKFQGIENSGIMKGINVSVLGTNSEYSCFYPDKFIDYVRSLAASPLRCVDNYGLTVARAQLMAYYRFKGFLNLPDIFHGSGFLDDISVNHCIAEISTPSAKKAHSRRGSGSQHKRKNTAADGWRPRKLSESSEAELVGKVTNGSGVGSEKKLKVAAQIQDDYEKIKVKKIDQIEDPKPKSSSPAHYRSFKIGESICRVASKLTSLPAVKGNCSTFSKSKNNEKENPFLLYDSTSPPEVIDSTEPSCMPLDELLCQLFLAAREPTEIHASAPIVFGFFTGFHRFRSLHHRHPLITSNELGCEKSVENPVPDIISKAHKKETEEIQKQETQYHCLNSTEDKKAHEGMNRKRRKPFSSQADDTNQHDEIRHGSGRMSRSRHIVDVKSPDDLWCRSGQTSTPADDMDTCNKVSRKRGRSHLKHDLDVKSYESVKRRRGRSPLVLHEGVGAPGEVKRRRGRPPSRYLKDHAECTKVVVDETSVGTSIPETGLSTMTPSYMNDSYWTDVVICSSPENQPLTLDKKCHGSKEKQALLEGSHNVEKAASINAEFRPSMAADSLKQLEVPTTCPNKSCSLLPEQRMSYIADKCTESNPTAFILNFANSNSLPSETELVRIFSRYGPLKDAETEVQRHLNFAKVVFKKHTDAEAAFANARKYNFFGHALLSFRLRKFPSTSEHFPESTFEGHTADAHLSSSFPSLSSSENGERVITYCTPRGVHDDRDGILQNCAKEGSSENNDCEMEQSSMEIIGAEQGQLFESDKILAEVPCSNRGVAGGKEQLAFVNTSLGETQGPQGNHQERHEDEFFSVDVKSGDALGWLNERASQNKYVLQEDLNSERVGKFTGDNMKLTVGDEGLPSTQVNSDPVSELVNHVTGESQGMIEADHPEGSRLDNKNYSEVSFRSLADFKNIENQGIEEFDVQENDASVDRNNGAPLVETDKFALYESNLDEVLKDDSSLKVLPAIKAENLVDGGIISLEVQNTKEHAHDFQSEFLDAKRLEIDLDDSKLGRIKSVARPNVQGTQAEEDESMLPARCVEGQSVTEFEVTRVAETMKWPEHKGVNADEKERSGSIMGLSDKCDSRLKLEHVPAISGVLQAANSIDACLTGVKDSGDLHVHGDGNLVEVEIDYGMTIGSKMVETLHYEALTEGNHGSKAGTAVDSSWENLVEGLVARVETPVDSRSVNSSDTGVFKVCDISNFASTSVADDCIEASDRQIGPDTSNLGKPVRPYICKFTSVVTEPIKVLNLKDSGVASSNAKASDPRTDRVSLHKIDHMHADHVISVSPGPSTDAATLSVHAYKDDESHGVESHLDNLGSETDVNAICGLLIDADNETKRGRDVANQKASVDIIQVPLDGEDLEATSSKLDNADINDASVNKSFNVRRVLNLENGVRVNDVFDSITDASVYKEDVTLDTNVTSPDNATDEINAAVPLSVSKDTKQSIPMPEQHMQTSVNLKVAACQDGGKVGVSMSNLHKLFDASCSEYLTSSANKVASLGSPDNKMEVGVSDYEEYDVPHSSIPVDQHNAAVTTPDCDVLREVLPCEVESESSCAIFEHPTSRYSDSGVTQLSRNTTDDQIRKADKVVHASNFKIQVVNNRYNSSVEDDSHVASRTVQASIVNESDAKLEACRSDGALSSCSGKLREITNKENASLYINADEILAREPVFTGDYMDMKVCGDSSIMPILGEHFDVSSVKSEHFDVSSVKSDVVHVHGECLDINNVGNLNVHEVADVKSGLCEGDEHMEASSCLGDKVEVSTAVSHTGNFENIGVMQHHQGEHWEIIPRSSKDADANSLMIDIDEVHVTSKIRRSGC